jgi:pyruvate formate lyase activating enzyme
MNKKEKSSVEHSMKVSNELYANVHSIETFGAFDGPGIRYVLFLQGCPFECKYCHNRDTWNTALKRKMTVDEVLSEYQKYSRFYKKGGITVSGGEPLLQIEFLIELFKSAKERNIHTCLDTSGATFHIREEALFKTLIEYTDLVLLDIKHIDEEKHKFLTKRSNKQVLDFAKLLSDLNVNTIIRHVLVPTLTDDLDDLMALRKFLDTLSNVIGIEVLPYHRAGISKWKNMGYTYELEHIDVPTKETIENAENILKNQYTFKQKNSN